VTLPDRPGNGAELDLEVARRYARRGAPFFDELLTTDGPVIEDGYVTLPDRPGNGAELDLEVARRYARPGAPFFDEPA
jgi:L-alanine-DL-glutamate epimerase-like enolase superfamily enzyme